jgi:hypothetical protein
MENDAAAAACVMCGGARPSLTSGAGAASSSSSSSSSEWTCSACTFANPPEAPVCAVCGNAAPLTTAQQEQQQEQQQQQQWMRMRQPLETAEERAARLAREAEDRRLAERLSEPTVDCVVCMTDYPIGETFTLDCTLRGHATEDHRYCYDCIRRQVGIALKERKLPACMMCHYELSQREVVQLFGDGSEELERYLSVQIGSTMAAHPDQYIACPRPNCPQYVVASAPGQVELCKCPSPTCGFVFCSRCRERYHGKRVSCDEAKDAERRWLQWLTTDKARYLQQAGLEARRREEAARKFEKATAEAAERLRQEEADEAWKESHCKMCPHCGKVVYKVDGCNVSGEENESYGFMVVVVVVFFFGGGSSVSLIRFD